MRNPKITPARLVLLGREHVCVVIITGEDLLDPRQDLLLLWLRLELLGPTEVLLDLLGLLELLLLLSLLGLELLGPTEVLLGLLLE